MNTQQTKLHAAGSKLLFAAMTTVLATTSMASDLDIYKATSGGSGGGATMIIIDTTASMTKYSVDDDYSSDSCDSDSWEQDKFTRSIDVKNYQTNTTETLTYKVSGCKKDTTEYIDRIGRARVAIAEIMADPKQYGIKETARMGLALFAYEDQERFPRTTFQDGQHPGQDSAYIQIVPNELSFAHRKKIINALQYLSNDVTDRQTNNPLGTAYSALGAYMLGTINKRDDVFKKLSIAESKTADAKFYKSPVTARTCGESNILLMTAGEDNENVGSVYEKYKMSLQISDSDISQTKYENIEKGCSDSVKTCMQQYSKFLRLPSLRKTTVPTKGSVVTAMAVFDKRSPEIKELKATGKTKSVAVINSAGNTTTEKVYNCTLRDGSVNDLCLLAEKSYGFGEGGFDIVDSTDDVRNVILAQLQGQNKVKPASTGTFSLPINSINPDKSRGVAYLPFLERPESLGSQELWKGNLKKYKVADGTIKGGNDRAVLLGSGLFTKNTYDLWNVLKTADEGKPLVGGVLSKIFATKPGATAGTLVTDTSRKVYVDDGNGDLKSVSINAADSKPSGFNALSGAYTADMKRYLAHLLGYPVEDTTVIGTSELKDSKGKRIKHSAAHKIHGAVLHSKPQLIAASSKNGVQKDYMLYGSFDGALHVVDDSTGKEKFAFVPKHVLKHQGMYFNPKTTKTLSGEVFGVDAPWTVYSDFKINTETKTVSGNKVVENTVSADQVYAMGGLRMGGSKYYMLDLTDNLKNDTAPKVTVLGSEYGATGTGTTATTNDYHRMGQTWGKTNVGFIKTTKTVGTGTNATHTPIRTMVAFLPGGYDMCYEDAQFSVGNSHNTSCKTKTAAQGNAVYMTKVATFKKDGTFLSNSGRGDRLWWASSYGSASDNETDMHKTDKKAFTHNVYMKHSIVSDIVPLDRDYDGYTDHLYYSDLGGQVFRVDINNHPNYDSKPAEVVRVVRLLDVSDHDDNGSIPRFYEPPLVSFMRADWDNNKIIGVVSVGSGNRSRPLHKRANDEPDRIYTFIDYDLARNDAGFLNSSFNNSLSIKPNNPLEPDDDLEQLTFRNGSESSDVKAEMTSKRKSGWYYDLEYWKNATTATPAAGLKMFSPMFALNKVLFFATFNPDGEADVISNTGSSCDAVNKGATQSDTLCLPFGSCTNSGYGKAKYQSQLAGLGIVSNDLGMVEQVSSCTGTNCDTSNDPIIKIIKNQSYTSCKMSDEDCNPLNSETSIKKRFYPKEWQER